MPNSLSAESTNRFEPELVSTMRSALDAAVDQIDIGHRTPATKAKMAQRILRAVSDGVTDPATLTAIAIEEGKQPAYWKLLGSQENTRNIFVLSNSAAVIASTVSILRSGSVCWNVTARCLPLSHDRRGIPRRSPSGIRFCPAYFRLVEMVLKLVDSLVPTPCTAAMIARAMPAAIRPYSIAVAPDSSFTKRATSFFIGCNSTGC